MFYLFSLGDVTAGVLFPQLNISEVMALSESVKETYTHSSSSVLYSLPHSPLLLQRFVFPRL